jgi:hypothetical protein
LPMSIGPLMIFIMLDFLEGIQYCAVAVRRFATLEPLVAKISWKQHVEFYAVTWLILWHRK